MILVLLGCACVAVLGFCVVLWLSSDDVPYERQWPDSPLVDDAQIHAIVKGGK